jgi:hypothetical protein
MSSTCALTTQKLIGVHTAMLRGLGTRRRHILAGYGPPPKPLSSVFLSLFFTTKSQGCQAYCRAHHRLDPACPVVTHIYHILPCPWCHASSQLQPPPTHTRQLHVSHLTSRIEVEGIISLTLSLTSSFFVPCERVHSLVVPRYLCRRQSQGGDIFGQMT